MTLDCPGGELWPFPFRTEQYFDLQPSALTITRRMTNCHLALATAAIGLRPFFPRDEETVLQLAAKSVWRNGAEQIPVDEIAIPPAWDCITERELGRPNIDNGLSGSCGADRLTWPERRIFAPGETLEGRISLVVEPIT